MRKRANVPLTEEFLNNLNALQVTGMNNYAMNSVYDMEPWNQKSYAEKPIKVRVIWHGIYGNVIWDFINLNSGLIKFNEFQDMNNEFMKIYGNIF